VKRCVYPPVVLYDSDIVPGFDERDALGKEESVVELGELLPAFDARRSCIVCCEDCVEAVAVGAELVREVAHSEHDVQFGLCKHVCVEATDAECACQASSCGGHDLHEPD